MTRTAFVTVDGCRLEVRRIGAGQGLPIVLLHEGLGSASAWRDFPDRLAERTGREVIAWSRDGYGESDIRSDTFETDYMHREADKLPAFLAALGIQRAHLYGHSDGGSIALIAASRYPDRVASLALAAPHIFVEPLTVTSIAKIKQAYLQSDLGGRLSKYHANAELVFWRWNAIWLDSRFLAWNIEPLLPAISTAALLIQGLDDEYGTLAQLDGLEAVLPAVRRVELPACRHSPHREKTEEVLAAMGHFLSGMQ